ncbi:hypothetical protein CASFOL_016543 [Castilleja foliolosa]|uniref:BHLH domain-containing protein n=1 Tax=Castilleja foliolosa TaxID=1961234 RepID=A0ABD3DCF4_9LAMI
MEMEDMFDLNPNQSEIYSTISTDDHNHHATGKSNNNNQLMNSNNNNIWEYSCAQENLSTIKYSSSSALTSSSSSTPKVCTSTGRTTLQARDHVVAERRRRQNLSQLFISLSQIVPGLKKLDKASVLEDAINHLKELQEKVGILEDELSITNFINTYEKNDSNNNYSSNKDMIIKVRISDDKTNIVLIKIDCKKQKGLMSRVTRLLEKMHLSVVDIRIMPFGSQSHLHITLLAQMQSEFKGTVKDIAEQLQRLFVNPIEQEFIENN